MLEFKEKKLFSKLFDSVIWLGSARIWLSFFGLTLLLRIFTPPQYIEYFYSRGVYIGFRKIWDSFFGWLPIPLFYVFWGIVVLFLLKILKDLFILIRQKFWWKEVVGKNNIQKIFYKIIVFLSIILTFFFWLWGFNYARIPFEQQIGLRAVRLDTTQVTQDFDRALKHLISLRKQLTSDSLQPLNPAFASDSLEALTRLAVQKSLSTWGLPHEFTKPRLRELRPSGVLLRFGASGVYWIWAAECNMDAGLHALEKPFTAAHELAHGYGWTDEAVCNFIAFVACTRPDSDARLQYSAWLSYFRYLVGNLRRAAPFTYEQLRPSISQGIRADAEAIRQNQLLYKDFFDTSRFYDTYLKTQGVKEGMMSYSKLVLLVHAYFEQNKITN